MSEAILQNLENADLTLQPQDKAVRSREPLLRLSPSVASDSVRPHRQQPTRLSRPWDSPGKNAGAGCHFLLQCMKVKSESEAAQSCLTQESDTTEIEHARTHIINYAPLPLFIITAL